jgi:glycosyltransferase involved in cell wall biosynthesis
MTARPAARIGCVLNRFPHLSQRLLLDEILELESRGVEVHLFFLQQVADRTSDPSTNARWIASQVVANQIQHLHAHFATTAADVAREVRRLTGVTYSFTADMNGIYHHMMDLASLRAKIWDAEFVTTPNNVSRRLLVAVADSIAALKIHRIYPGVDLDRLRFHAEGGRDPNSVLAVAPLVERSGLADLLEAIRILADRRPAGVRLTIVGEGELEMDLRAKIASYELISRVTILRHVARSRLLTLMRTHALMALPYRFGSEDDADPLPAELLEAMAVGLPVISTPVRGISEVIQDGQSGRLITPEDSQWLAGALETMLDNHGVRMSMAKQARDSVENRFALSRNVSQFTRLLAGTAVGKKTIAQPPISIPSARVNAATTGTEGSRRVWTHVQPN